MMRDIRGLALSLPALMILGGTAMAQTPPAPMPGQKPPAMAPAAPSPAQVPAAPAPKSGDIGPGSMAQTGLAQTAPPEGMVIETPNGFYLVRPGETAPHRLDMGPAGPKPGAMARDQESGGQDGDMPMDEMAAEDGGQPQMAPRPHKPMPPRPEGKGARFRIRTPNLTLGMKCPDDEPIRACMDAVSELIAKTSPQAH